MTSVNNNNIIKDEEEAAADDETPANIPVRWAEPKKNLRKQTTRLTIIEEPVNVVTLDDDDEPATSTSKSQTPSWKRLNLGCTCSWAELDRIQKKFLMQGVAVRAILMAHTFFVFYAAMVHVHVSAYVCLCLLYAALSITEGIIMYNIRGFSQKKWICTSTLLYTASVVPAIWALHSSMLNIREKDGYKTCLQNYSSCLNHPAYDQLVHNDTARAFVAETYSDYERLTMVVEYTMVFILIFCRWLLPRDNFTREKVAQLLLVLVGSGEDIIEFVAVIFTSSYFGCSRAITVVVLLLWSIAVFQFSIAIPEKTAKVHVEKPENAMLNVWVDAVNQLLSKRRETAGDVSLYVAKKKIRPHSHRMTQRRKTLPNISRNDWVHSTEFREAIISITIQDGPFLIFRLVILSILGDAAFMVFFYALKNLTVILLNIYRVYAMLVEFRQRRRNSLFPVQSGTGNEVENKNMGLDKIESEDLDAESDITTVNEKAFAYTVNMVNEINSDNEATMSNNSIDINESVNIMQTESLSEGQERAHVTLSTSSQTDLRTRRQSKTSQSVSR